MGSDLLVGRFFLRFSSGFSMVELLHQRLRRIHDERHDENDQEQSYCDNDKFRPHTAYLSGEAQTKLPASFVSPVPLYFGTCG